MPDMRSTEGRDEEVPQPYELACDIGQVITVDDHDLDLLTPGEYDVLGETAHITVAGMQATLSGTTTVRRVS